MEHENNELQVENGSYTRIVNRALDELIKLPLLGSELSVCLFVIRKTYGFNKTEDLISLTQFQKGINRSRPTIIKSIKKLTLVNILLLSESSEKKSYKFNKYYKTWDMVKAAELVKTPFKTSKDTFTKKVKTPLPKLVKTGLHTKDKIQSKDNIQKKEENTPSKNAYIFFKGMNDLMERIDSKEATSTRSFLQALEARYTQATKGSIWLEVKRFVLYWTESNHSGTKQRWQLQETFQVDRRLVTWFSKIREFQEKSSVPHKTRGKKIIRLENTQ